MAFVASSYQSDALDDIFNNSLRTSNQIIKQFEIKCNWKALLSPDKKLQETFRLNKFRYYQCSLAKLAECHVLHHWLTLAKQIAYLHIYIFSAFLMTRTCFLVHLALVAITRTGTYINIIYISFDDALNKCLVPVSVLGFCLCFHINNVQFLFEINRKKT